MYRYILFTIVFIGFVFGVRYFYRTYEPTLRFVQTPKSVPTIEPADQNSIAITPQTVTAQTEKSLGQIIEDKGLLYPPTSLAFLAFKREKTLEVWLQDSNDWIHLKNYPILGASGVAGPKLREGDMQVPEGLYRITWLNHNSAFHLSLKLNYPNAFDRKYARLEGRLQPGSNIFIHGEDVSTGCLAIGNPAIEELFHLVEQVGRKNIQVIIAPYDFRRAKPVAGEHTPKWTPILYQHIQQALSPFSHSS